MDDQLQGKIQDVIFYANAWYEDMFNNAKKFCILAQLTSQVVNGVKVNEFEGNQWVDQ